MDAKSAQAFLEEACAGDTTLLEEVASLLRMNIAGFLEGAPILSLPTEAPERIGPFRVGDRLGQGSQGTVFRGRRAGSGDDVALKMVGGTAPSQLARFRREIHTLSQMRHPGVVRILDWGVQDGVPWYAMELLEGSSLADRLAEAPAPLPPQSRLDIGHGICTALAHVHGEGIVHRDLKPANVMLRPDGTPVLVDFGVAGRFTGHGSREQMDVVGPIVGTVLYMAPEQIRGELVDARADLYALGCILYELVTGRPPFRSDDPRRGASPAPGGGPPTALFRRGRPFG